MTTTEYLTRKDILLNTTFRITPEGKGYFLYQGKQYSRFEFYSKFPLPVSLASHNKPNYDGTKSFLYVD
jgi:hypothetical protein